jgi:hypothetical protein
VHLLVILHPVGTWVFSCCEILVSLGGYRHLDDLGQLGGGPARVVFVCGQLWHCEGFLWFPDGALNSNSSGLLVSLQPLAIW